MQRESGVVLRCNCWCTVAGKAGSESHTQSQDPGEGLAGTHFKKKRMGDARNANTSVLGG